MPRLLNRIPGNIPTGITFDEIGPYVDVHMERIRAHRLHDDNHESMERRDLDDPDWTDVLVEEVGELSKVRNEFRHGNLTRAEFIAELRKEAIQVAAMACALVDAIDDNYDE